MLLAKTEKNKEDNMDYLCNIKEEQSNRLNGYYVKFLDEKNMCIFHTFINDCNFPDLDRQLQYLLLFNERYKRTKKLYVVRYSADKKRYKTTMHILSFQTEEDRKWYRKQLQQDYELEYMLDCNTGIRTYDEILEQYFSGDDDDDF